jgi:hypothetical protein
MNTAAKFYIAFWGQVVCSVAASTADGYARWLAVAWLVLAVASLVAYARAERRGR